MATETYTLQAVTDDVFVRQNPALFSLGPGVTSLGPGVTSLGAGDVATAASPLGRADG